jgi:RNA polymerase sigma-70 factor (ECF subfamily)
MLVDADVVRRAQHADQEAFAEIVNESLDRLFAIASLMTRDRSLAEDAVQDAMLRAWRDLPKLRDVDRLPAWLSRLTVNATYDLLRKRRKVRELKPLDDSIAAHGNEAAQTVDRALVLWAYGQLPAEQRAIVVLHYYVGLSLDEAADTLAVPRGTVRSRLHAALGAMRRAIAADDVRAVVHQETSR